MWRDASQHQTEHTHTHTHTHTMYLLSVFLTDLIVSLGPPPDCLSPFARGWGKAGGGQCVLTRAPTGCFTPPVPPSLAFHQFTHTSIVNPPPPPCRGGGGGGGQHAASHARAPFPPSTTRMCVYYSSSLMAPSWLRASQCNQPYGAYVPQLNQ